MQGLKGYMPDITFSGNYVTGDEIDRYEVVTYINPTTAAAWVGAGTASGPTGTATFTAGTASKVMDYPRNLRCLWTGGSGTAVGGTVVVVGKDQFGSAVTETIVKVGTTAATVEGTQIFSQITSWTPYYWTTSGDVGTVAVGGAILGTTAKLGLPFKLKGTADIAFIAWSSDGTQVVNNKGSVGALIDTTYHAIKALKTFEGTMGVVVWGKSTRDAINDEGQVTGLHMI